MQMKEAGIMIEGGAMRSVFAAGVLDFLLEKGIEIPNVLAVSAGAYAGMNYISGQMGRAVDAVIKPLEKEKYMGAKTFLKKGTFFDMDYLFDVVPKKQAPFDFETFKNSAKRFIINTYIMRILTRKSSFGRYAGRLIPFPLFQGSAGSMIFPCWMEGWRMPFRWKRCRKKGGKSFW